ncbi:P-loop ATPase, Sll1717 family [Spongiibacter tropicus]|uniref:P-loop ATPase, Sll1717 family n=1 Tax=Spongiibacter tropicus TaxID=454602 RepID=UPI003A9A1266
MIADLKGFFAYAASPREIGDTVESAIKIVREDHNCNIQSWTALDIPGHFISQEVLSGIDDSDYLIADISVLNFNVTYEIGYAIGRGKRVLICKNRSIQESSPTIRDVGIFDTIGYEEYENSKELGNFIATVDKIRAIPTKAKINTQSPVYLLDALHKTDWMTRIVSRIKKSRFLFRTFDPNEQPRLSASEAIHQVAQSHGAVVPLLQSTSVDAPYHNIRASFIAGLTSGMDKALCLLQQRGHDPIPIDYRDIVNTTNHLNDVNEFIAEFAGKIAEAFQADFALRQPVADTFLESLDLGASSAENEMRTLEEYYLRTDQFLKSLRGEANIVVGRKGSGKSAIFLQIRDRERSNRDNIVLDLKPDGYKLIKFKETILSFLQEGTLQHTIMAFWEYVLLLEICYKILESDREFHLRDHDLYEAYRRLAEIYHAEGYDTEGDFSERMSSLMEKISTEYRSRHGDREDVRLSVAELTELLYCHDVKQLSLQVAEYMQHKDTCWLLFDNIDKGWPTSGLEHDDLLIIRTLLDATKKIEKQFNKHRAQVNSIVFLRNDVYELLVQETADKGKEAKVVLDWTDSDLLREVLRLRIASNEGVDDTSFEAIWPKICVSHYKGEETSQYLIEHSLMRPRFLIDLLNQCKSFAINLNHEIIQESDFTKGLSAFSTDLLTDIGYEINDIAPYAKDALYSFIGSSSKISMEDAHKVLSEDAGIESSMIPKLVDILLWYGFLGISVDGESKYIYDLNYNMKLLQGMARKQKGEKPFVINRAFWPALMIDE